MAGESDKFEVYQDKRGEWRWRRKASNGKIVGAATEGYKSKADAEANMKRGKNAKDKWEFYKDKRGQWRWRRMAVNGNLVGASSEGYNSKGDAEANAGRQGWSA
jgi:uncharacterized protein YegP (UPF0339 family)